MFSVIVLVVSFVTLLFIIGMSFFHTYLALLNATTNEEVCSLTNLPWYFVRLFLFVHKTRQYLNYFVFFTSRSKVRLVVEKITIRSVKATSAATSAPSSVGPTLRGKLKIKSAYALFD
jgi:hypothetical protein